MGIPLERGKNNMDINLADTKLMFAHEVVMATIIRTKKTKRGAIRKESCAELIFIDAVKKQAISRIILPLSTLEDLPQLINDNIKNIKKELKNKEMPKQPKIKMTSSHT